MEQYVGIRVSLKSSSVCVVDAASEFNVTSKLEALAQYGYERRALSRRRTAIRALEEAQAAAENKGDR